MNVIKSWFQNLLLKRMSASVAQLALSFVTAHSFGQAGTLSDLHWVVPQLGIDLVFKLTVDPATFEAGLFLFMITGTEWVRHYLAERYPDSHWL